MEIRNVIVCDIRKNGATEWNEEVYKTMKMN